MQEYCIMQPTKSGSWPQWPHSFPKARETITFPVFPMYSQFRAQSRAAVGSPRHAGRWAWASLGTGGHLVDSAGTTEQQRPGMRGRGGSTRWDTGNYLGNTPLLKKQTKTNPRQTQLKSPANSIKRDIFLERQTLGLCSWKWHLEVESRSKTRSV